MRRLRQYRRRARPGRALAIEAQRRDIPLAALAIAGMAAPIAASAVAPFQMPRRLRKHRRPTRLAIGGLLGGIGLVAAIHDGNERTANRRGAADEPCRADT